MNLKNLAYTSDNPNLDYRVIFKKLSKGNFSYIFGRFYLCRQYYSQYRKIKEIFKKSANETKFPTQIINQSQLDVKEISTYIKKNSYYDQLTLNQNSVNSIVRIAENSLDKKYRNHPTKTQQNHKIAMMRVDNPLKIEEIYKLRYDQYLLNIASEYLGYFPTNCDVRLWWSFANNLSFEERRRQNQTIDYHYDIHGLNFFYVSFYLTDVDIDSGAHVLVKGSHINKKISFLLRSARVPEEMINKYYSPKDIITIQGTAGKCFLEDSSCFHKALPPIKKDRLLLQLRYF